MKYYIAAPIFLVGFLIQTTLSFVNILGFFPNIVLCLMVVFSFLYDENYGIILGIIFGVLLDLSTQQYFGTMTLLIVLSYVPIFFLRHVFNNEKVLPDMLMSVIATLIYAFGGWTIHHIFGSPVSIGSVIDILPALVISNAIIVCVMHLILVRTIIRHRKDRSYYGGVV
ncbi:MAG: rod shape-determining protein MreD [Clostridiales Family XIII bacterium]|jgi:rod shape-determining protein MreD|nr:rod shape-determining protein MreD [Clostridiales Family XIII bacterium]